MTLVIISGGIDFVGGASGGFVGGTGGGDTDGRGSRALIGCIILGTLRNGLTLMNVQAFYQLLATGIIIIVAMLIDKVTSRKEG